MADDQRAVAALEDLLEHDDVAVPLELQRPTTFIASLSMTSWPRRSASISTLGADGDAQLAAAGEDVDGAVLVRLEEDAEAGRRLGEPVDLFLERDDLVAGLTQRRDQPLVLPGDLRQAGLRLGEPLLERRELRGVIRRAGAAAGRPLLRAERSSESSASCTCRSHVGTVVGVVVVIMRSPPPGNGPVISHPTVALRAMFQDRAGRRTISRDLG